MLRTDIRRKSSMEGFSQDCLLLCLTTGLFSEVVGLLTPLCWAFQSGKWVRMTRHMDKINH